MSILAIDYGAKKIGLAKSNQENTLALPLEVIRSSSRLDLLNQLKEICRLHEIIKVVVGVPVSLSNGDSKNLIREVDLENKHMQEVLGFISWLKTNINLPVEMEDERLSTKMANTLQKGLSKKGSDDDIAAMLILQNYLDRLRHRSSSV